MVFRNLYKGKVLDSKIARKLSYILPVKKEIDTVGIGPFPKFDIEEGYPKIEITLPGFLKENGISSSHREGTYVSDLCSIIVDTYLNQLGDIDENDVKKKLTKYTQELDKKADKESEFGELLDRYGYTPLLLRKKYEIFKPAIEKTLISKIENSNPFNIFKDNFKKYYTDLIKAIDKGKANTAEDFDRMASHINHFWASLGKVVSQKFEDVMRINNPKKFYLDEMFKYHVASNILNNFFMSLADVSKEITDKDVESRLGSLRFPGLSLVLNNLDKKTIRNLFILGSKMDYSNFIDIQKKLRDRIKEIIYSKDKNILKNFLGLENGEVDELIQINGLGKLSEILLYNPNLIDELDVKECSVKEQAEIEKNLKSYLASYKDISLKMRKTELLKFIYDSIKIKDKREANEIKIYDFANPKNLSDLEVAVMSIDTVDSTKLKEKIGEPAVLAINKYFISYKEGSLIEEIVKQSDLAHIIFAGEQTNKYCVGDFKILRTLLSAINFLNKHEQIEENPDVKELAKGNKIMHSIGLSCGYTNILDIQETVNVVQYATEIGASSLIIDNKIKRNHNSLYFIVPKGKEETTEDFLYNLNQELISLEELCGKVNYNYEKLKKILHNEILYNQFFLLESCPWKLNNLKLNSFGKPLNKKEALNWMNDPKTAHYYFARAYVYHKYKKIKDLKDEDGFSKCIGNLSEDQLRMIDKGAGEIMQSNFFGDYPLIRFVGVFEGTEKREKKDKPSLGSGGKAYIVYPNAINFMKTAENSALEEERLKKYIEGGKNE